ncbi:MAG: type II toxin-antitoxin system HicB family antitoxin [Candidatus Peregrinibacteria bacterium]|nr:type II toxin-antitoxin system HicB family antitoxin [Candidatus Peregrinibacteria bacterium]
MNTVILKRFSMISFKVEKDGEKFHAFCPELTGCHTFGDNPEEALKNLKNAVSLYLDNELEEQTFDYLINEAKKNVKI